VDAYAGPVPLGEGEGFFGPTSAPGPAGSGEADRTAERDALRTALAPVGDAAEAAWGPEEHWDLGGETEEAPEGPEAVSAEEEPEAAAAEPIFPIADYDDLRVNEIVPLLPELDPDELAMVRERELAGKARATLLARIDALLGTAAPAPAPARKAASGAKAAGVKKAGAKAAAATKAAAGTAPVKRAAPAAKRAAAAKATTAKATKKAAAAAKAPAKKSTRAR
jgi:hypothetical protein